MSLAKAIRASEAACRREERSAKIRQRQLAKMEKERAKLSEFQQAQWEVEAYENQIERLLSIHRDCAKEWNWSVVASKINSPSPALHSSRQQYVRRHLSYLDGGESNAESRLEAARA